MNILCFCQVSLFSQFHYRSPATESSCRVFADNLAFDVFWHCSVYLFASFTHQSSTMILRINTFPKFFLNKKVTNFYFLLFCEASQRLQYCKCCFTDCCVHECTTRMRWKKRTCAGRTRWRLAYRWSICWKECQAAAYDKLTHLISFCVKLLVLY